MTRLFVLISALVFIGGFGYLTIRVLAEGGVTVLGVVSVFVVILLAVGIVGALRHPPR
jgi:hypothetical protein